jgi:hypothetical protein
MHLEDHGQEPPEVALVAYFRRLTSQIFFTLAGAIARHDGDCRDANDSVESYTDTPYLDDLTNDDTNLSLSMSRQSISEIRRSFGKDHKETIPTAAQSMKFRARTILSPSQLLTWQRWDSTCGVLRIGFSSRSWSLYGGGALHMLIVPVSDAAAFLSCKDLFDSFLSGHPLKNTNRGGFATIFWMLARIYCLNTSVHIFLVSNIPV